LRSEEGSEEVRRAEQDYRMKTGFAGLEQDHRIGTGFTGIRECLIMIGECQRIVGME